MFRKMWKISVRDESDNSWFCAYVKIVLFIPEILLTIILQESRDFLMKRRLASLRVLTHTWK